MSAFRPIEIDFDVHKLIETERSSFSESANDVLRRLLGIGGAPSTAVPAQPAPVGNGVAGASWRGRDVTLPHGTQTKMSYNGRETLGSIQDGNWIVDGKKFGNPSPAASSAGITKAGKKTQLDGWKYWSVKRPGDSTFVPLSTLRPSPGMRSVVEGITL